MNKELKYLLDNYEKTIYGQAFPIDPSTHQLHLLLDYIANLDQQVKKQKEVIDKVKELITDNIEETTYEYISSTRIKVLQRLIMDNNDVNELLDILKEVE